MDINGIKFNKMNCSGNDFIIINNMDKKFDTDTFKKYVPYICKRKLSVGADGLIILEPSENVDFKWRFFNSDGSEAEMCGNGARCASKFSVINNISPNKLRFETLAGIIEADVYEHSVKIKMTPPHDIKIDYKILIDGKKYYISSINTGVPHVVKFVKELENYDVKKMGREIRYNTIFQPSGTNVNFVSVEDRQTIKIRTYERGVEDETLACGTGSVASAIIAYKKGFMKLPIYVKNMGGEIIKIDINQINDIQYDVFLEGEVANIYEGVLLIDSVKAFKG